MTSIRNFTKEDIDIIQTMRYPKLSKELIHQMVEEWDSKVYDGRYFEMFAVKDGTTVVGMVSLYQRTTTVIHAGIHIFNNYRQKGYASQAVILALNYASRLGYNIAVAPVRIDNIASIALHKKLGFEIEHEYVNSKGNAVYNFIAPIDSICVIQSQLQ